MKLSFKTVLPILLISAMLILLIGCFAVPPDESPGYTGESSIKGIIAAPCCSTSSTAVSGNTAPSGWCLQCEKTWFLQNNIEVILTNGKTEIATTKTNGEGKYTFSNVPEGINYVITAICPDNGGKPLVKDVIKEVLEGKEYDAGITDCESTALGLMVDALINLGISSEFIILEDIQNSVKFGPFVNVVCEVLEDCGNVTSDDDVLDQGNLVLMDILTDNPGWTGGEVICVFNPPDDPCAGVPAPTANAGGPYSDEKVCTGEDSIITFAGSGSGKGTLTYDWDFGDGTTALDAGPNPSHKYLNPFTGSPYTVTLTVTDDCDSTTDTAIVTIDLCINNAPTITSIPDKDIAQGNTFNFTVSANDPDGDNLFYEIVSGPSTMTINSSTGAITWIADCADPVTGRCHIICSKEVTVKVTDDGCCPLSDQDTFIINVWDQLP